MEETQWALRREGEAWEVEGLSNYNMVPEKIELIDGKLFRIEEYRLTMPALLLEHVGVNQAVRIGNSDVWRAAVSKLPAS